MDIDKIRERFDRLSNLQKDAFFLGVCLLIIAATAAVHNHTTPDEPVNIGYVEVQTNCIGFEVGDFCIGAERQDHTTYNYDNYTGVEEGSENFYRRVEAELMAQANNICSVEMEGMEWTDEAEYRNQTGTEWMENENIELWPCSQAIYRNMTAAR
jgi:hypothetical protein